jgi:heme-degrading monooxygenase HmoA
MYFVVFESTTPESREDVSTQYYITLQKLLQTQPGFISETPLGAPHDPTKAVLIGRFVDEESMKRWRLERTHLDIQRKARRDVMEKYKVRLGPSIASEELLGDDATETQAPVVTLHQRRGNEQQSLASDLSAVLG